MWPCPSLPHCVQWDEWKIEEWPDSFALENGLGVRCWHCAEFPEETCLPWHIIPNYDAFMNAFRFTGLVKDAHKPLPSCASLPWGRNPLLSGSAKQSSKLSPSKESAPDPVEHDYVTIRGEKKKKEKPQSLHCWPLAIPPFQKDVYHFLVQYTDAHINWTRKATGSFGELWRDCDAVSPSNAEAKWLSLREREQRREAGVLRPQGRPCRSGDFLYYSRLVSLL